MPSFRHRLKPAQQREYDRSDRVTAIPLPVSARMRRAIELLEESLAREDRTRTERIAQILSDEICTALRVPGARVCVEGVRRSNRRGELHGLFTSGPNSKARIQVWMFTAKRRQVVAFKTFLRTLLHEVCHHLDYELLRLSESLHTDGFFQRESSLVRQLANPMSGARAGGANGAADPRVTRVEDAGSRASAPRASLAKEVAAKVRNLS